MYELNYYNSRGANQIQEILKILFLEGKKKKSTNFYEVFTPVRKVNS